MSNLYDGHGDIIYPEAIDERIKRLKELAAEFMLNEDGKEELEELKRFRDDVQATLSTSAWTDSSGFVAESYFEKYTYDHACDIFGSAIVELPYWDQDAYEDDHRDQFEWFEFDGGAYLVDKD